MQHSEEIKQNQDINPIQPICATQPFFDIQSVEMPRLVHSPSMGQAVSWMPSFSYQPKVTKLGFLTRQEQMNHQSLFDRQNYFMSYHSQTLGRLKMKYSSDRIRPQDIGKYLTNLLVFESGSNFFFELYTEVSKVRYMFETYISDYFIRQRFERVRNRDKEISEMAPEDKIGLITSFAGYNESAYRRIVDQQTSISESVLSDLH